MSKETLSVELEIDKGCVLITEAGHHFGLTDVTIAKAMLIYHHYQKVRQEYDTNFQLFATAAFSLSVQICQEDLKMEEVIEYFHSLGKTGEPAICALQKALLPARLLEVQCDISQVVFKCPYKVSSLRGHYTLPNIDIAHRFVFAYMDQFATMPEFKDNKSSVKTMSLKFLNTFYHSRKCLSYTPLQIAWAAMYLSCLLYNIKIEKIKCLHKELTAAIPDTKRFQSAVNDMTLVTDVATRSCTFTS